MTIAASSSITIITVSSTLTTSNSLQYSTVYVTSSPSTPAITIISTLTQSVTITQQSYNTIESKLFNNQYSKYIIH